MIPNNNPQRLFKKEQYNSLTNDDLDCLEHNFPKKYWIPELKKFYCEHDDFYGYEMVHFKFILDNYSDDIKILKNLSDRTTGNSTQNLNNIFTVSNYNFDKIYEMTSAFNESLKDFGNNFLKSLFEISDQDAEIYKLKDIINSIKFNEQGKADYVGIGSSVERETNYLRLAKILISRNVLNQSKYTNLNLKNNLLNFMEKFAKFLTSLVNESNEIFKFSYSALLQELCRIERNSYDNSYLNIMSPVVLREEISNLTKSLSEQVNLNTNLSSKISQMENEIINKTDQIKEIDTKILNDTLRYKTDIDILNGKLNNLTNELNDERKNSLNFSKENKNLTTENKENKSKIHQNIKIIEEVKSENNRLTTSEKNLLSINSTQKINYETMIKETERNVENSNKIISDLNAEIEKLRIKELEKNKSTNTHSEEITKLRNFYEPKLKSIEQTLLSSQKNFKEEKSQHENKINELLNTIENQNKIINDLNVEIGIIGEKLHEYTNVIENLQLEKSNLEEYETNNEEMKFQMQSQIKQNELLIMRIEELEKIVESQDKHEETDLNQKLNEFKEHFDEILVEKEKLELELVEKKNKLANLILQVDNLNFKNEALNTEINLLKEQAKTAQNIHTTIKLLTSQLEEMNNLKANSEMENMELRNSNLKFISEVEHLNEKLEESENLCNKFKEELNTVKNYDKKYDILQNSKMEIDKLKSKLDQDKMNSSFGKSTGKKMSHSMIAISPTNFSQMNNISQDENPFTMRNFNESANFNQHNPNSNMKYTFKNSNSANFNNNSILKETTSNFKSKPTNNIEPSFTKKFSFGSDNTKRIDTTNDKLAKSKMSSSKITNQNQINQPNKKFTRNKSLGNIAVSKSINFSTPSRANSRKGEQVFFKDISSLKSEAKNMLFNQDGFSLIKTWLIASGVGMQNNLSFNLLMRASRDGFDANTFKKRCHNRPSTLIIVHTSHDKVIGGYNPHSWKEDNFAYVPDLSRKTFLFSLTNQKKYQIHNLIYAICNGTNIGPIFGGGSDLEIVSNCNVNYNNFAGIGHTFEYFDSPEEFYGANQFLVKDYEVYEVKY